MARTGINRHTGELLTGWAHVAQSINDILTTPAQSRVFRRAYGGDVSQMIDAPMNDATIMTFFVLVAMALEGWVRDGLGNVVHKPSYGEPGFKLRNILIEAANADGKISLILAGDHYPKGHLGDFSEVERIEGLRVTI